MITKCYLSTDSFVLMLCYCTNLKAIRYESTSLNGIVANKSHRVIVAQVNKTNFTVKDSRVYAQIP